eukprot:gene2213-23426_t
MRGHDRLEEGEMRVHAKRGAAPEACRFRRPYPRADARGRRQAEEQVVPPGLQVEQTGGEEVVELSQLSLSQHGPHAAALSRDAGA